MNLTDDMEDSTPPRDYEGAKSPPVTDAERGASYNEIPEQSDETRLFVARISVILKGLSTVQYDGQVGKILPRVRSGKGQDSSGFDQRGKNAQRETYKSPGGGRCEGIRVRGNQACGPENSMPSLEDDGNKTPAVQKEGKSRGRRTRFQKVACRKRRRRST